MRRTPKFVKELKPNEVLIFGSNTEGRHGKGLALQAINFGAVYGQGIGHYGQTYAIPTREFKSGKIVTLSLDKIKEYVLEFINYAKANPNLTFLVSKIGTGLAGLEIKDIAPMFVSGIPIGNIHFPEEFWNHWRGQIAINEYDENNTL